MVNVDPIRKLASDLRVESVAAGRRMAQVMRKTGADIERDAKIGAPVDTGFHRSSISTTVSIGRETMTVEVGPTSSYGIFLELGTSRMGARPHLFPAADRHEPGFLAAMAQAAEPKI